MNKIVVRSLFADRLGRGLAFENGLVAVIDGTKGPSRHRTGGVRWQDSGGRTAPYISNATSPTTCRTARRSSSPAKFKCARSLATMCPRSACDRHTGSLDTSWMMAEVHPDQQFAWSGLMQLIAAYSTGNPRRYQDSWSGQ